MKKIVFLTMIWAWVLAVPGAYAQQGEGRKPSSAPGQTTGIKHAYFSQEAPGREPRIFAPGIVSQPGAKEAACTFSPDGREFYFTQSGSRIMVSRWTEQGWTIPAPFQGSAGHRAIEPHVTLDNRRIYWNWDHPDRPGAPSIYFCERTADGWSEAKYAGQGMFVSSDRGGNMYVTHLGSTSDFVSRAVMDGNRIIGYEDLKGNIEKLRARSDGVAHPCIAPDGSYIVFDIEGGRHLFVSFKGRDGMWGEAIDLAEHGIDAKAGIASISPDGNYLFFGQNDDIYWVSTQVLEVLRPKK